MRFRIRVEGIARADVRGAAAGLAAAMRRRSRAPRDARAPELSAHGDGDGGALRHRDKRSET